MTDGTHHLGKLNAELEDRPDRAKNSQVQTEPSEAAMWEAIEASSRAANRLRAIGRPAQGLGEALLYEEIALAIDRHAVAQREKDAKMVDDMASNCRRTAAEEMLVELAAAIRSAP